MSQVFAHCSRWAKALHAERGATAVEYAMMVALIAVVITASVSLLGGRLGNGFGVVGDVVANSPSTVGGGGSNGANNNGQGGGWGGGVGGGQSHN